MALSLQDPTLAKRRFFHAVSVQEASGLYQMSMQFFSWLMQQGGRPQLQVVEHDKLSDTDVVIADAAATILAWCLFKDSSTATYAKATDNATTGSDAASELRLKLNGANKTAALFYPQGLAMANGITCQGTTTSNGGTGSGTDGATGVFLLAAAGYEPPSV